MSGLLVEGQRRRFVEERDRDPAVRGEIGVVREHRIRVALPATVAKRSSGKPLRARISRTLMARPAERSHGLFAGGRAPGRGTAVWPVTAIRFGIRRMVGAMASSTRRVRSWGCVAPSGNIERPSWSTREMFSPSFDTSMMMLRDNSAISGISCRAWRRPPPWRRPGRSR